MFRLFTNARLGRCTALRSTSPLAFSNKRYFAQLPESVKLADLKQAKNCFTSIPRSIIRVEGPHASKFLQGLITNNINILNKENTEHVESMYSTLLNVQGRVIYDFFATKTDENTYLLDFDADLAPSVIEHFNRYKLRSKVKFFDITNEFQVWVLFGKDLKDMDLHGTFTDPRSPVMGMRSILSSSETPDFSGNFTPVTPSEYHLYRVFHGVSEGKEDFPMGSALPFESNLEFLHGVHFQKGCYIGQELTHRTRFMGVIRKRLLPIRFISENESTEDTGEAFLPSWVLRDDMPQMKGGLSVKVKGGKATGKTFSTARHLAMAKIRLEHLQDPMETTEFEVETEEGVKQVKPLQPFWWNDFLDERKAAEEKLKKSQEMAQ